MPRLTSFGPTSNDLAICGSAVAITVVSRYSMKKAAATTKGSTLDSMGDSSEIDRGACMSKFRGRELAGGAERHDMLTRRYDDAAWLLDGDGKGGGF